MLYEWVVIQLLCYPELLGALGHPRREQGWLAGENHRETTHDNVFGLKAGSILERDSSVLKKCGFFFVRFHFWDFLHDFDWGASSFHQFASP